MKTGAIYVRVSTEEQARESYSIDAQIKAIKKYAKDNDIFIDSKYIFKDEGFSGRVAEKRPAFMQMIATAKTKPKPFDYILIHKYDRFARNREDSIVYKSLLKKECDISVLSVTEPIDHDDKTSIIMESWFESMAEYYSLNLSEEVSKGQIEKHSKGEPQTCPSLGYDIKDNCFVINEDEAKIVRYVFERYANDNIPMLTIAKELNELGFRTKKGNKFENRQVNYILHNITYIGKLRYTPGGRQGRKWDDKNTLYSDGKHKPIIKIDLWNKAQELLKRNTVFSKPRQQNHNITTWTKGLIRCKECGCTMVKCGKNNLRCNGYAKGKCYNHNTINREEVQELILNQIKHDITYGTIENIVDRSTNNKEIDKYELINTKLKQIDNKLERVKYAFMEGIDSIEEYKQNKQLLIQEKDKLEKELKTQNKKEAKTKREKEIIENGKTVYEILNNKNIPIEEKYMIVHSLINKVEYDSETNELLLYYN